MAEYKGDFPASHIESKMRRSQAAVRVMCMMLLAHLAM